MFARGLGGSSDYERQARCAGQQRCSCEISQHLGVPPFTGAQRKPVNASDHAVLTDRRDIK